MEIKRRQITYTNSGYNTQVASHDADDSLQQHIT